MLSSTPNSWKKYNTSSKKPKYYEDNPDTENNLTLDRHFFKVHMDAAGIQYVYCPVRQVKRCICIEMLYVTSGDIFYLRLILLNRKARSDQDVLTYYAVRGGGEPLVCTSYQQSAIAHGYVDGPEGRSLYCLNLNCRAPPGRFFRLDLTVWWWDV